jgi:hypothetical protein
MHNRRYTCVKFLFLFLLGISATVFGQVGEDAFRVKKPIKPAECTNLLKLPQYRPTKGGADTLNVVWLDSVPPPGTCLALWNSDLVIAGYGVIFATKGEIYKMGVNKNGLLDNVFEFWGNAKNAGGSFFIEIYQVYYNGRVSNANWSYTIRFK